MAIRRHPHRSARLPTCSASTTTPTLMGPVNIIASVNDGTYDEMVVHFERRFSSATAIRADYVLAYARGMGGVTDGAARQARGPADSEHRRRRPSLAVGVRVRPRSTSAIASRQRRAADLGGASRCRRRGRRLGAPVHAEPRAEPER